MYLRTISGIFPLCKTKKSRRELRWPGEKYAMSHLELFICDIQRVRLSSQIHEDWGAHTTRQQRLISHQKKRNEEDRSRKSSVGVFAGGSPDLQGPCPQNPSALVFRHVPRCCSYCVLGLLTIILLTDNLHPRLPVHCFLPEERVSEGLNGGKTAKVSCIRL